MNVVAVIQARLGSSRFPGKMLANLYGRPVIQWVVSRLRDARLCNEVVVATSDQPQDRALAEWCDRHRVPVYRGSEADVLARVYDCAAQFEATHIARITGDCPLIDWRVVDELVGRCLQDATLDYATNCEPATFPEGLSAEVVPMQVLSHAHRHAVDDFDRGTCHRVSTFS